MTEPETTQDSAAAGPAASGGGERRRENPLRANPLRVNPMRRAWLSPVTHCLLGLLAAAVVVSLWLKVHRQDRSRYDIETEPALVSALAIYQTVLASGGDALQLMQDGEQFRTSDAPVPGALGIGRLPGIRGVLVRVAGELDSYNRLVRERAAAWRRLWQERANEFALPYALVCDSAAPSSELLIPKVRVAGIKQTGIEGMGAWLVAAEAASLAEVPDGGAEQATPPASTPGESSVDAPETTGAGTSTGPDGSGAGAAAGSWKVPPALSDMVAAQVRRAQTAHASFGGPSAARVRRPLTSSERLDLRRRVLAPFRADVAKFAAARRRAFDELTELVRRVEVMADGEDPSKSVAGESVDHAKARKARAGELERTLERRLQRWQRPTATAAGVATPEPVSLTGCLDRIRRELNTALSCELYTVTLSESGYLWFFGAWKWWEVVWWTWFGVLAMGLFQVTSLTIYGRGLDGCRWDPRDSFKMLARGFYAPLLAIVFFWLAIATEFINESSVLATNTFGVLATAFLIGLAPNHLLRLMLSTLKVIVRGGENPEQVERQKVPPAREVKVPAKSAEGSVPTTQELAVVLKRLATGPLE